MFIRWKEFLLPFPPLKQMWRRVMPLKQEKMADKQRERKAAAINWHEKENRYLIKITCTWIGLKFGNEMKDNSFHARCRIRNAFVSWWMNKDAMHIDRRLYIIAMSKEKQTLKWILNSSLQNQSNCKMYCEHLFSLILPPSVCTQCEQ